MARSYYARKLWQIVDDSLRLCRDFRESQGDGRKWRFSEVVEVVNDVILAVSKRTGILRDVAVIPLAANINVYDLPANCVKVLRVGINGMEGTILLPTTVTKVDLMRNARSATGEPTEFFREFLASNQIGFFPIPSASVAGSSTGSSFIRDHDHGLLRRISDADGVLPFDAGRALRTVRGVPFEVFGTGRVVRELLMFSTEYGNIEVWYQRNPTKMVLYQDYPDVGLPEFFHPYLKYGVAIQLLGYSTTKIHSVKIQRFGPIWNRAVLGLRRVVDLTGPMTDVRPL